MGGYWEPGDTRTEYAAREAGRRPGRAAASGGQADNPLYQHHPAYQQGVREGEADQQKSELTGEIFGPIFAWVAVIAIGQWIVVSLVRGIWHALLGLLCSWIFWSAALGIGLFLRWGVLHNRGRQG